MFSPRIFWCLYWEMRQKTEQDKKCIWNLIVSKYYIWWGICTFFVLVSMCGCGLHVICDLWHQLRRFKSSHLYLYSALYNTDCVKEALQCQQENSLSTMQEDNGKDVIIIQFSSLPIVSVQSVKRPKLSKPKATVARNQNSIGDRMEKNLGRKQAQTGLTKTTWRGFSAVQHYSAMASWDSKVSTSRRSSRYFLPTVLRILTYYSFQILFYNRKIGVFWCTGWTFCRKPANYESSDLCINQNW